MDRPHKPRTWFRDDIHVHPVNDIRAHDLSTRACWCEPRIEVQRNGTALVVHRSADWRELVEAHGYQ